MKKHNREADKTVASWGNPEQVHNRHSGVRRNPVKSSIWTPAFTRKGQAAVVNS
ncbi:MAG: hypothetical protein WCB97_07115 [Thiobacillus sp.]